MHVLRTPSHRFENLPGYGFAEHYVEIPIDGGTLRMHYLDEGDPSGEVVVLLHGEPSWSYLYRKVIPPLAAAGYRVIAPDLIGFGKSDKPAAIADYTYDRQVSWLRTALFDTLELHDITLYAQDWGGLLSLRLVAFEPERFARVMIGNTGLPAGGDSNFVPSDGPRRLLPHLGARAWKLFARWTPVFPIGRMAQALASETKLSRAVRAGYDAPFPSNRYKAGARAMPQLIPLDADSPDGRTNREAWRLLAGFEKPFRTAFSDRDHAMRMSPVDTYFQRHVKGAEGQRHVIIEGAGHFLQEDKGERVADVLLAFMAENPLPTRTNGRSPTDSP